jgi:hypothetical protein
MVRQAEITKPRHTNMSHSSINAAPKKDGSGGSYTWGDVAEVTDYELVGFDVNSVGVITAAAPCSRQVAQTVSSAPLDVNLEDQEAFPSLLTSTMKLQKVGKPTSHPPAPEMALPMEDPMDWVIVLAPTANTLRTGALDLVDGQHPRNLFAKKPHVKQAVAERSAQEQNIDWSQAGIPNEVKTQIIKASRNAAHQGVYAKEQAPTLTLDMLRAQNVASSRRENSASRSRQNSVPRSRSKPRTIQQPTSRR